MEPWKMLVWLSVILVIYAVSVQLFDVTPSITGLVFLVVFSFIGIVGGRYLGERLAPRE